jgi:hypothetical protein
VASQALSQDPGGDTIRACAFSPTGTSFKPALQGGSGAALHLVQRGDTLILRKSIDGQKAEALKAQVNWLQRYEEFECVPKILSSGGSSSFFFYDMDYVSEALTFDRFPGSPTARKNILAQVLGRIRILQTPLAGGTKERKERLQHFLKEKVLSNLLEWEKTSKDFFELSKNKRLFINGKSHRPWKDLLSSFFDDSSLISKMAQEPLIQVHGDLTYSNILVTPNNRFFLIDPNPINLFSTPSMEFAKLLQS